MKCSGFDANRGAAVEITGSAVLQSVEEFVRTPEGLNHVAPGFIDIQVNGFAGVDYCSPTASMEEIGRSLDLIFSTGTTRIFPTVITGGREEMLGAIRNLAKAKRSLKYGRALEGFHIEGPHISPHEGARGAHPLRQVRPPDTEEFDRWQDAAEGNVRLVTVSPEWLEAPKYIEHVVGTGVVVSIGHLDANAEQIDAAVRAGATLSTHLGNGAHGMLPRHPNYLWHQMADDRLAASFIVDGIHLDKSFLTVALRSKGLERAILITDAVMPAMCEPGPYMLGEVEVQLHPEGKVTLRDDTNRLAGSALRMDAGVGNLMKMCGVTLSEAITLATRNPARVGRVPLRQRGLQPGERADVVEYSYDKTAKSIRVLKTWLDGELVFSA
ncbi:N-acetylglucosamine-6-phosphate deacetylase [Paludibaculum fermentans]|uniref:Amidohydrolase family protein n=1 Tax=Paludibaculum fermentans TaxID=1473598 RepID=A0A7S7NTC5_PALFE|nr:amidohydrolase family protein [Paludibaculum fermentans]QOY89461.1 amidohydrolase family protein [Paludibaculum fermentans]